jgi:hypothetical protein
MIVQAFGERVRLIAQHDHALQAGVLARAWGAPPFTPPSPLLVRATALHDAGWQAWDARPRVDSATGLPYRFFEMPVAEHLAIFRRSVAAAFAEGDFAGLLVSLHTQGLYNGRFGLVNMGGARVVAPAEEALLVQFLGEQVRLQDAARARLGLSAIDPELWRCYRLLQVWDILSLFSLAPQAAPRWLPTAPAGSSEEVALELVPLSPGVFTVTPWPFRQAEVETRIPIREVPFQRYDDQSLGAALAAARPDELRVRFLQRA